MKRLIFFSILSIAALVQLSAQSHQRITLIDGTVVEGYVSTRHFGKEFLLTAVETEMSMPSSLAGIIASQNQKVEYIPDAWKKWLKKHPEAVTPGSKTLDLSRMSVRDIAVAPLPADADDAQSSTTDALSSITLSPKSALPTAQYSLPSAARLCASSASTRAPTLSVLPIS